MSFYWKDFALTSVIIPNTPIILFYYILNKLNDNYLACGVIFFSLFYPANEGRYKIEHRYGTYLAYLQYIKICFYRDNIKIGQICPTHW